MSAFDFDAAVTAPFRMQPGLRRLAAGRRTLHGLTPDAAVFAEKLAVLSSQPHEALLCAEAFDARPAWQALAREAALQCPETVEARSQALMARRLGCHLDWDGALLPGHVPSPAADCLAALPAAQRVPALLSLALHEDFAVIDGATTQLQALAVCLPSHWAPAEKIGLSFAAVHAPVADNAVLLAAAHHLMQLVSGSTRWERFVWTVTPHPVYDQHPQRHPRSAWPDDPQAVIDVAHWRTEHQSFLPLPDLRQAVFTIHVDMQPLVQAIDTPARAAALHAALASMSEAVLDYRQLRHVRTPLLDWLAMRASAR